MASAVSAASRLRIARASAAPYFARRRVMSACFWNVPSSTNWTPRGWMFRGSESGVRRVRGGAEKKTNDVARGSSTGVGGAKRRRAKRKQKPLVPPPTRRRWHAVVVVTGITNYPLPNFIRRGKRRRAARTRREARRARPRDTKCRSGEGVAAIRASAFRRPTFRMASIKLQRETNILATECNLRCVRKTA